MWLCRGKAKRKLKPTNLTDNNYDERRLTQTGEALPINASRYMFDPSFLGSNWTFWFRKFCVLLLIDVKFGFCSNFERQGKGFFVQMDLLEIEQG